MIKIGDKTINPTKIVCLGLNYQDHIDEFKRETPKEPVLFNKTLNCLIGDGDPIIYPKILYNNRKNKQVDYEVELAFVMILLVSYTLRDILMILMEKMILS